MFDRRDIDISYQEEWNDLLIEEKISFPEINILIKVEGKKYFIRRSYPNEVTLELSDMLFSMNAEHYYGVFTARECGLEKGDSIHFLPGFTLEEKYHGLNFKVKKKLTRKEAIYLNKKNSYLSSNYKAGQYTNTFDTPEEMFHWAKLIYDTFFDPSVKISYSGDCNQEETFLRTFNKKDIHYDQ